MVRIGAAFSATGDLSPHLTSPSPHHLTHHSLDYPSVSALHGSARILAIASCLLLTPGGDLMANAVLIRDYS